MWGLTFKEEVGEISEVGTLAELSEEGTVMTKDLLTYDCFEDVVGHSRVEEGDGVNAIEMEEDLVVVVVDLTEE